jgi:hypothetical protein
VNQRDGKRRAQEVKPHCGLDLRFLENAKTCPDKRDQLICQDRFLTVQKSKEIQHKHLQDQIAELKKSSCRKQGEIDFAETQIQKLSTQLDEIRDEHQKL